MTKITQYQIYGERSSGTTILDASLNQNFEAINAFYKTKCITDKNFKKYGHKHWFGDHLDLSDTDDTLFLCIIRNPIDWLKSLYKSPRCLDTSMIESQDTFLNGEVISACYVYSETKPPNGDLHTWEKNPVTGRNYKNIFELRHEKIKWMMEVLPNLVKNYMIIRYEDLMDDFQGTMKMIKEKGLKKRINIDKYIHDMKLWMKRDGYKNVETTKFEFAQKDPKQKLQPVVPNINYNVLNLEMKDYPKDYIYYETILGYYK